MGMCVQKVVKLAIILVSFGIFFGACEAMDTILPSTGHYKVNFQINGVLLDDCSFIRSNDEIFPYFEEPVSDDKDVTGLIIYLRDSAGETIGRKVSYDIDPEKSNGTIIPVESLDDDLPPFPIPANLPMGKYSFVFQVMSGKDILQKTEKPFFYLGVNNFSFSGVNLNIPGVTDTPLIIPKDTIVMLEAVLDFDTRFSPYIIWYEGKNKISEGRYSDGAAVIFWKAPDQSGFSSLRAEVFPFENHNGYKGYQDEISVLVSSKGKDFNLVEDISQLMYWYTFESDLNDSKIVSDERALSPAANNIPIWKGINGTYGLSTGQNNSFSLPKIIIPNNDVKTWQTIFRFKPLNDDIIFSVFFSINKDVSITLRKEDQRFKLTLQSPSDVVSQFLDLPIMPIETDIEQEIRDPFLIAGISFSVLPNQLTAQFNLLGINIENELISKPISLKVSIKDEFQVILGSVNAGLNVSSEPAEETQVTENAPEIKNTINVLWDEFAIYYMPPMEAIIAKLRPMVNEY